MTTASPPFPEADLRAVLAGAVAAWARSAGDAPRLLYVDAFAGAELQFGTGVARGAGEPRAPSGHPGARRRVRRSRAVRHRAVREEDPAHLQRIYAELEDAVGGERLRATRDSPRSRPARRRWWRRPSPRSRRRWRGSRRGRGRSSGWPRRWRARCRGRRWSRSSRSPAPRCSSAFPTPTSRSRRATRAPGRPAGSPAASWRGARSCWRMGARVAPRLARRRGGRAPRRAGALPPPRGRGGRQGRAADGARGGGRRARLVLPGDG